MKVYLSFDPSLRNTGIAIGRVKDGSLKILDLDHKRTYKNWGLNRSIRELKGYLNDKLDLFKPDEIIFECPRDFKYSGRGSSIDQYWKLGMSMGAVLSVFSDYPCIPIFPDVWKKMIKRGGKASKDETKNYLKLLGFSVKDHNAADALAILIYYTQNRELWLRSLLNEAEQELPESVLTEVT